MANDPVCAYVEARNALNAAAERIEWMVRTIADASSKLQNWQEVVVSDIAAARFPRELLESRMLRSIDGGEWPTGPQLAEALLAWHTAREATRRAWEHVSPRDRQSLQPPV